MIYIPSRFAAVSLMLAVGFGLGTADAQTVADAPSAADRDAAVPVASVAPATAGSRPLDASIAPKDSHGRHIAPHDTLYLLDYVSVMTGKGVEGFAPGQEVHFVSADRAKHTLVVSDGRAQVEVEPSKLTNDMDIAALVQQKDQNNQARITAYVQAEQVAYDKAEKAAAEASAKDIDQHNQAQVAESRVGNDTALNQPTQQTDTAVGGNAYADYNYGGSGYGSPYSYFGGGSSTTVVNAPQARPAAPAAAPAAGASAGGVAGGSKAGVSSGGAVGGRPK